MEKVCSLRNLNRRSENHRFREKSAIRRQRNLCPVMEVFGDLIPDKPNLELSSIKKRIRRADIKMTHRMNSSVESSIHKATGPPAKGENNPRVTTIVSVAFSNNYPVPSENRAAWRFFPQRPLPGGWTGKPFRPLPRLPRRLMPSIAAATAGRRSFPERRAHGRAENRPAGGKGPACAVRRPAERKCPP